MNKNKVTVYTARKVWTMDPGRPETEAVAVLDGNCDFIDELHSAWWVACGGWRDGSSGLSRDSLLATSFFHL